MLVTGATDGLGRGAAQRLAAAGATVLVHGRDPDRVAATVGAIAAETGRDRLRPLLADLADLAQVRALAAEVERTTEELHALVSNAGIGGRAGRDGAGRDGAARRAPTATSCAWRSTTWPASTSRCASSRSRAVRPRRGS